MQRDDGVCKVERAAVRQAHWMCDDIVAEAGAAIAVLRGEPDGYRRDERHLCPVGTVEFCREWMRLTGVAEPVPIDYPASLRDVLGRVVQCVPFADARSGRGSSQRVRRPGSRKSSNRIVTTILTSLFGNQPSSRNLTG